LAVRNAKGKIVKVFPYGSEARLRYQQVLEVLVEAAKILNVSRQSIYYWIKKGWIKPRRDYRKYPVFTVFDSPFMRAKNFYDIL